MNITGKDIMIFAKEDEYGKRHYRAGLSSKNKEGEYENGYIDVRMPKDTMLENKTKINITKGFLSFYNYKDKQDKTHTIWYIVVQEYTTEQQMKKIEVSVVQNISADEVDNMPLPF